MADLTVRQNAQQVETWFPDAEKHRPLPDPGGHAANVQNSSLGVGEPPVPPGLRLLPILPHNAAWGAALAMPLVSTLKHENLFYRA